MIYRTLCYLTRMLVDTAPSPQTSSGAAPRSGRRTGAEPCTLYLYVHTHMPNVGLFIHHEFINHFVSDFHRETHFNFAIL